MEYRNAKTIVKQFDFDSTANFDRDDELARQRLEFLLAANAEKEKQKRLFRSEQEKTEAALMSNPLDTKQTYAFFGLVLGAFTPAAIFARFLIDSRGLRNEDLWILGIVALVNVVSAITGYFSGKAVGKIVSHLESCPWWAMIALSPFVGLIWGIVAGGAGGIIIFVIGAFFGAMLGGAVGSLAVPTFTILHRLLKKGDFIERKHFLPLAFGIAFTICGFILGL